MIASVLLNGGSHKNALAKSIDSVKIQNQLIVSVKIQNQLIVSVKIQISDNYNFFESVSMFGLIYDVLIESVAMFGLIYDVLIESVAMLGFTTYSQNSCFHD
ncbi:hypothetical protein CHS0354_027023 [Potamilus streckersoni]|uniref:Uncharacterized protein n=1 Tax=Potamilus streckersoni TaxID=2493646 RepID=A0AAE0W3V7_9BIVA|nr:hypothetical protein CHS0354_027023 [Potamilus streckersoni]